MFTRAHTRRTVVFMTKFFFGLTLVLLPQVVLATPTTFDLRDPAIELIDEVNSFSLTINGLTATLSAVPATFNEPPLRTLLLNQTSSSFGINVDGTTCGGTEQSGLIDGGCVAEAVQIVFDYDVVLNNLRVSSFGAGTDQALVTIGATTIPILSTGLHNLGDVFLAKGSPWLIAYVAGNGFSFDSFAATPVPEPSTLLLLSIGGLVAAVLVRARGAVRQLQ